jgi:putative ABC transport system ATP-binding protein
MVASGNNIIIEARGLHKYFGTGPSRVHALRGLDLTVRDGEFLAVMGPSGCGKSTLLHVLGLMTPAHAGDLRILNQPVGPNRRERCRLRRELFGFVFQRFNLLGVLSARDNVTVSMRIRKRADHHRIDEIFDLLRIADVADRRPSQMSIGQMQRVAVARALAHEPRVIFADEPTGNLDSANADALLELFQQIHRERRQTIVMITHSASAAERAQRVVHMKDGGILE